jgi:hypothetical protein
MMGAIPTPAEVLALSVEPGRTIRDYLVDLLAQLWSQGSDFSAKRPLGDSDWQWVIYAVLVRAGAVGGTFDSAGYLDTVDHVAADKLLLGAINTLATHQRT